MTKQQQIKRLVEQEILKCQTSLIEKIFEKEILCYDDVENMYNNNEEAIDELDTKIDTLNSMIIDTEALKDYSCWDKVNTQINHLVDVMNVQIDDLENDKSNLYDEDGYQEVFEWWLVSNWLCEKLKEKGEPILDCDYGTWWGRTCTGQSIELDNVIHEIAEDIVSYTNSITWG